MPFRWEGYVLAASVTQRIWLWYFGAWIVVMLCGGLAAFLAKQRDY